MNELIRYEAARQALIEASSIDEVKSIRDKAEAMRAYARQAGDLEFQNMAAEIKIRAERKAGGLLIEMEENGERATQEAGINRHSMASHDVTPTLADLDVTRNESSRWQKIANVPEQTFENKIKETVESRKELTSAAILKLAKEAKKEAKREAKSVICDAPIDIIHADFREVDLEENSVDIIITDPPYPKEYISLYGDLAKFGAHVLKPGGLVVAMAGQSYLPELLYGMSRHMEYLWTCAYLTPGGQAVQVFPRKVNTFWKPLLVFSKGAYQGDWFGDVMKSDVNDNDKDHHHWGQSESGMADIVDRFTYPGQLIVDPFCGAGTTGVVAREMSRSFIGIEIESEHYQTADSRCA